MAKTVLPIQPPFVCVALFSRKKAECDLAAVYVPPGCATGVPMINRLSDEQTTQGMADLERAS